MRARAGLAIAALWCAGALAAGDADVVACQAEAYVVDPDPAGLNVRAGPGRGHEVIGKMHAGDLVDLTGARGEWLRIGRGQAESPSEDYVTVFAGEGWVHGGKLAVGGAYNENQGTPLHERPDAASPVLRRLAFDDIGEATLRGCRGGWLDLDYGKGRRGWVESGKVCVNLRTECS
jgi:uncharacterized protein YraI